MFTIVPHHYIEALLDFHCAGEGMEVIDQQQHLYKTLNRFQGQLDPNTSPVTTSTRCWSSLFLLPATATLESDTTTDNKVGENLGYELAKAFPYLI